MVPRPNHSGSGNLNLARQGPTRVTRRGDSGTFGRHLNQLTLKLRRRSVIARTRPGQQDRWAPHFGVKAIASIRGLAITVSVAAAAVGPILVGVSYQATGSYAVAAAILMVIPIAVGILILAARAPTPPQGVEAR